MTDDYLSKTEEVCKNAQPGTLAWWMRDWVLPLIAGVRERDAALRAAQARAAELESAARIDIDAANAECASRDCKAWIDRGMICRTCPCDAVSVVAGAMGIESAAAQKLADAGQVTP